MDKKIKLVYKTDKYVTKLDIVNIPNELTYDLGFSLSATIGKLLVKYATLNTGIPSRIFLQNNLNKDKDTQAAFDIWKKEVLDYANKFLWLAENKYKPSTDEKLFREKEQECFEWLKTNISELWW